MANQYKNDKHQLTSKQLAFVVEYVKDLNATQAAKRAGYSEKNAESIASNLLKNIKVLEAIKKVKGQACADAEITPVLILQKLKEIMYIDPRATVSDELKATELAGRYLGMWDGSGGRNNGEGRDRKNSLPAILETFRKLAARG